MEGWPGIEPEACKNRGGGAPLLPTYVGAQDARDTILFDLLPKRVEEPYLHDIPMRGTTKVLPLPC